MELLTITTPRCVTKVQAICLSLIKQVPYLLDKLNEEWKGINRAAEFFLNSCKSYTFSVTRYSVTVRNQTCQRIQENVNETRNAVNNWCQGCH